MTKKEIKEQIAYDEQRLKEVQGGYRLIPEYVKIQEELDELNRKKAELEKRQTEIRIQYREDSKEDLEFAREELKYSTELLRKAEMGLDPKEYNDELIKMFNAFYNGGTWGDKKKLQWVSDDGCYAIFKIEAHSGYTTRATGVVSSPASWALFVIDSDFNERRLEPTHKLCLWRKEGGRWSDKRDLSEVMEVIDNYENNTFMSEHMKSLGFELVMPGNSRPKWVNSKVIVKSKDSDYQRECYLYVGNQYYLNMPKNIAEFEKKYENLIKEINENK